MFLPKLFLVFLHFRKIQLFVLLEDKMIKIRMVELMINIVVYVLNYSL